LPWERHKGPRCTRIVLGALQRPQGCKDCPEVSRRPMGCQNCPGGVMKAPGVPGFPEGVMMIPGVLRSQWGVT
jgi:hypothetical protein